MRIVPLGPGISLALLLSASPSAASVSVAVLDTGFCPEKLAGSAKVTVRKAQDLTGTVKDDACKLPRDHGRVHGQKILEAFLAAYEGKESLVIHPYVVFDQRGAQTLAYWETALERAEAEKVDVILTASGLPHEKKLPRYPALRTLTFAPSGVVERTITASTVLFPQVLAPDEKLVLIGGYRPADAHNGPRFVEDLLYRDQVSYYQPVDGKEVKGTSYAVAVALGKALSLCEVNGLKACLKTKSKVLSNKETKHQIPTF